MHETMPIVETAAGSLRGRRTGEVSAFLGIPYAAPPFGASRLRAPQPARPWTGVRDATAYGPTVPKSEYPAPVVPLLPEVTIPGENCLNLNIWKPSGFTAAGLPVIV